VHFFKYIIRESSCIIYFKYFLSKNGHVLPSINNDHLTKCLFPSIRSSPVTLFRIFTLLEVPKQSVLTACRVQLKNRKYYQLPQKTENFSSSFIWINYTRLTYTYFSIFFTSICKLSSHQFVLCADQWTESRTWSFVCPWREVLQWIMLDKIPRSSQLECWQV
jgi:hypothetical protein